MLTVIAAFDHVYHVSLQFVLVVTCAWLVVCCIAASMARARWQSATLWVLYIVVFAALLAYTAAKLWAAAQG